MQSKDWAYGVLGNFEHSYDRPNAEWSIRLLEPPKLALLRCWSLVLEELELDPETATVQQLNELDPIFECVACTQTHGGRCVMAWETLVRPLSLLVKTRLHVH